MDFCEYQPIFAAELLIAAAITEVFAGIIADAKSVFAAANWVFAQIMVVGSNTFLICTTGINAANI